MSPGLASSSPTRPSVDVACLDGVPSLRRSFERLLTSVVALSQARAATVRLLNTVDHELQLVCAVEAPASFAIQVAAADASCGACGDAIRRNAAALSPAPCRCARALGADVAETGRLLAIPLHHGGQACGVLGLFLYQGQVLDPNLAGLLGALGELIGNVAGSRRSSDEQFVQRLTQERLLIANEVHDALAQNLTSIRMRTSLLRDAVQRSDVRGTYGYLGEIDESLNVAQSRVRELITHFRTEMDTRGLLPAIETTMSELSSLSGIAICFDNQVGALQLSADQELQVFYIVREALTNAAKHSGANEVQVRLSGDANGYDIEVCDNGVGMEADHAGEHGHFGLNIMRERAGRLGGELTFEPLPVRGTRVHLSFPGNPAASETSES